MFSGCFVVVFLVVLSKPSLLNGITTSMKYSEKIYASQNIQSKSIPPDKSQEFR